MNLLVIKVILIIPLFCGCSHPDSLTQHPVVPSVDKLREINELPDPFLFTDGRRVQNHEQWSDRRDEIKDILLEYEYGRMPSAADNWSAKVISSKAWFGGLAIHVTLTLNVGVGKSLDMGIRVYRPDGEGPFPVVLNIGDDASKAKVAFERGFMLITCSPEIDLDPDTEGSDIAGPAQLAYPDYDWGSLAVGMGCQLRDGLHRNAR